MTPAPGPHDLRNAHFDRLARTPGLKWLGQNTNHLDPHPAVIEAMLECVRGYEFHAYAPPLGYEELRAAIVEDLGPEIAAAGHQAIVTDGAVAALHHACGVLLGPGDELLTTDPTWNWPRLFAGAAGARVRQIPIYGAEHGYRLSARRLAAAIGEKTRLIYFVDPNNPLGSAATPSEIQGIAAAARGAGCYLVHDCTYRHFARDHTLAAPYYPERTLSTYSFSKWLGVAGLRAGAIVGPPDLLERLAAAPPNILGSSVLAQRAALAGLRIKADWFPGVLRTTRENLAMVEAATTAVDGLRTPVFPSNGNFLIIEVEDAGVTPEALCDAYRARGILIRQGSYHSEAFGSRFVKVSVSVPSSWAAEFCELLPEMVETARTAGPGAALY